MKKFISVLLVLFTVCLCFSACGKSEEAKAVEEKIKDLGEITIDKGAAIEEAEKAYAFLSGEDKGDVKNYDELVSAKDAYNAIVEMSERCDALSDTFDIVFSRYGIPYTEVVDEYNAILELIPDEEEGEGGKYSFVSEIKEKYVKYSEVQENANKSAVSYVKGFLELNKDRDITIEKIGCIAQISDEIQYFLFAMEYKEGEESKAVYSSARFSGTPSVQSMTAGAASLYGEAPASVNTDALVSGNVVIDVATVLTNSAE